MVSKLTVATPGTAKGQVQIISWAVAPPWGHMHQVSKNVSGSCASMKCRIMLVPPCTQGPSSQLRDFMRFPWQAAVEKTSFKAPLGPRDWSGSLVRKRSCTRSRSLIPGAMVTLEYLGFMDLDTSEIQTRDWRFRQGCGFTETHPRCFGMQECAR